MKTIFFFFWNLMMMVIKRANIEQSYKGTRPQGPLGKIYSFEAHLIRKQMVTPLPDRQKLQYHSLRPTVPAQKDPNSDRRATEWQIWCENNRMLFQSSA